MQDITKKRLGALATSLAVPWAVGGLASLLSRDGMAKAELLKQPPLAPPSAAFPIAWGTLYTLMEVSTYLIWRTDAPENEKRFALRLYGAQLVVNFLWPIINFVLGWRWVSVLWLVLLVTLVIWMIRAFHRVRPLAAWLQAPYLLWLLFATYLATGTALLN